MNRALTESKKTPDPWFLYNKTRDYINEARALAK